MVYLQNWWFLFVDGWLLGTTINGYPHLFTRDIMHLNPLAIESSPLCGFVRDTSCRQVGLYSAAWYTYIWVVAVVRIKASIIVWKYRSGPANFQASMGQIMNNGSFISWLDFIDWQPTKSMLMAWHYP